MTDDDLRRLLLQHRNRIAGLTLSQREWAAFWFIVAKRRVLLPDVAQHLGVEHRAACSILDRLRDKGYILVEQFGVATSYRALPSVISYRDKLED